MPRLAPNFRIYDTARTFWSTYRPELPWTIDEAVRRIAVREFAEFSQDSGVREFKIVADLDGRRVMLFVGKNAEGDWEAVIRAFVVSAP
jgi:hypothetical protein